MTKVVVVDCVTNIGIFVYWNAAVVSTAICVRIYSQTVRLLQEPAIWPCRYGRPASESTTKIHDHSHQEVFGDSVTFYGLAIEHTYKDMLKWHGEDGSVSFYQSEMPYDVSGDNYPKEVTGYRVHASAKRHTAKGVGVYSYFRDHGNVVVDSAICHHAPDGTYENIFTVWLNGFSGIKSIINGLGEPTKTSGQPFLMKNYQGETWWSKSLLMDLANEMFSFLRYK